MAGLSHLRDVYEKRGKEFLDNLLTKTVIINEKTAGAYFGAKLDSATGKFNFFKKDAKIGHVDRVLSKYYEPAILHIEGLTPDAMAIIPDQFVFGFEYNPKNHMPLKLSHIKVLDENYMLREIVHEKTVLNKWAQLLSVNRPGILFQGKLNEDQKIKIQEFVFTPIRELSEKFKTVSFTKHILSTLNPTLDEATSKSLEARDIDEIVFRFYEDGETSEANSVLAKLVDPVFYDNAKNVPQRPARRSDDYVWIIVIDLMNFIESHRTSDLISMASTGSTKEEKYVSLVNNLFCDFIEQYGNKYLDLDIQVPSFLTSSEFDINQEMVNDTKVIELINKNPNFKEVYRILMNIFRKKKFKINSPLFTDSLKKNLEAQIARLEKSSIGDLVLENYFPTFNEFVGDDSEPGYFDTFSTESTNEKKIRRVNLLLSEFQPIHNGHVKNSKILHEKNGLPTLLVGIHPGKTGKVFPFKKDTISNSLGKLAASDSETFAGHVIVGDGRIESILSAIKPNFEPVMIAAGPSRLRDLALQLELAKKRSRNLNIKKETSLVEIPNVELKDSIISSIREMNFARFKEMVPGAVHSEFYNMNKDISESQSIQESVQLLNESITIEDPKKKGKAIIDIE
jgi:hypothetical protein